MEDSEFVDALVAASRERGVWRRAARLAFSNRLLCRDDVADLVQEACLYTFRTRPGPDPVSGTWDYLPRYLMTVLPRIAYHWARKRAPEDDRNRELGVLLEPDLHEDDPALHAMVRAEVREFLECVKRTLAPRSPEGVLLTYPDLEANWLPYQAYLLHLEGLKLAEIAEELQVKYETVKKAHFRARKKVIEECAPEEPSERGD